MIYDIATMDITATISLNEAIRITAGVVGVVLHIWLIKQAIYRLRVLRWSGQNGALSHVAWTRIENEGAGIVLQLLMFLPSTYVSTIPSTSTALNPWGVWIIWSQALVSVVLTAWAWRRHMRALKLDALLAEKE